MPLHSAPVDPHEQLFVKGRKRFLPMYQSGEGGARELVLYCGLQEISFDEPDLFPWAEKLIQHDSFIAGAATTWSTEPLAWPRVKDLLEALIEAGLVARTPPEKPPARPASDAHQKFVEAERARPAPPVRFWAPDPNLVLREIAGRGVEAAWLEAVVPVHRVAHPALDREGRQVGEMNVFPEALRLKLPTEWKTCAYAGSRYHDEQPMNMTALKSMIAQWRAVLRGALLVREEFVRRFPQREDGRWKLGEVHFLSSCILALPGYELLRARSPVRNGDLDPVLSSLFRVTDGVRMVTNHMLDLFEWEMTHDHLVEPHDITSSAERENQYLSTRGVCAGPPNMIDELVETLLHGKPVPFEGELGPWTADIPAAVDYGLRGLQMHATTSSIWVQMGLAYTRIHEALQKHGGESPVRSVFERDFELVKPGRNHLAEQREWSTAYYRRMFENARRGLRESVDAAASRSSDVEALFTPDDALPGRRAMSAMRDVFASSVRDASASTVRDASASLLVEIADAVMDYLRFERHALRTVRRVQCAIDDLLGRPPPSSALSGRDLGIYHTLRKGTTGALPYLVATIEEALGIAIDNREDSTTVAFRGHSVVLP